MSRKLVWAYFNMVILGIIFFASWGNGLVMVLSTGLLLCHHFWAAKMETTP